MGAMGNGGGESRRGGPGSFSEACFTQGAPGGYGTKVRNLQNWVVNVSVKSTSCVFNRVRSMPGRVGWHCQLNTPSFPTCSSSRAPQLRGGPHQPLDSPA